MKFVSINQEVRSSFAVLPPIPKSRLFPPEKTLPTDKERLSDEDLVELGLCSDLKSADIELGLDTVFSD